MKKSELKAIIKEIIQESTKGELSIVKRKDNKYILIGPIYGPELTKLNKKGFKEYQDALDAMVKYGYKLYKS